LASWRAYTATGHPLSESIDTTKMEIRNGERQQSQEQSKGLEEKENGVDHGRSPHCKSANPIKLTL